MRTRLQDQTRPDQSDRLLRRRRQWRNLPAGDTWRPSTMWWSQTELSKPRESGLCGTRISPSAQTARGFTGRFGPWTESCREGEGSFLSVDSRDGVNVFLVKALRVRGGEGCRGGPSKLTASIFASRIRNQLNGVNFCI